MAEVVSSPAATEQSRAGEIAEKGSSGLVWTANPAAGGSQRRQRRVIVAEKMMANLIFLAKIVVKFLKF